LGRLRNLVVALNDRFKRALNPDDRSYYYDAYLRAKRLYRRRIVSAKKLANERFINEAHNPCKAAWSIVNGQRKKQVDVRCQGSPDEINKFFVETVEQVVEGLSPANDIAPEVKLDVIVGQKLEMWRPVSADEVLRIVSNFHPSPSTDIFGISAKLLKAVINDVVEPLTFVINSCLEQGVFPEKLKTARVVPVYKKGDREDISSHRPIAIVPTFSKVIEKIMYDQLVLHLDLNGLFSDTQHGFRKGRSTSTAVLRVAERVTEAFEREEALGLALLDLSKAFDVVSHKILLEKLDQYGVKGVTLETLGSYLADRRQVVVVKGASSKELPVAHGVPQGSTLGPLLFVLLVNDFKGGDEALLYADDTTLIRGGSSVAEVERAMEEDTALAERWFKNNMLQLNLDKTQKMICSLSRTPSIVPTQHVKLLGFTIDRKLNWQSHIDELCKKLSRVIFLLRRLKSSLSEDYLVTVYYGLFHSHLNYGILLWGHAPGCEAVLKLQKSALRVITSSARLEHCRPIFRRLGILTVTGQYIFSSIVHVKQNFQELRTRGEVHEHNTRIRGNIDIPRYRLSGTQSRFPALAWKLYNRIPSATRNLDVKAFTRVSRDWLTQGAFYSIKEYFEAEFP
jgi:hypothetical protein